MNGKHEPPRDLVRFLYRLADGFPDVWEALLAPGSPGLLPATDLTRYVERVAARLSAPDVPSQDET